MPEAKKHNRTTKTKKTDTKQIVIKESQEKNSEIGAQTSIDENKKIYKQIEILDVLQLIFAGVLAFYAGLTYTVYENQLKVQKIETRAWVGFVGAEGHPNANESVSFVINYVNLGKTPGFHVLTHIDAKTSENEIPDADREPIECGSGSSFGAGVTYEFSNINPFPLSVLKQNPYIFGTIWYTDIYDIRHWSQFCYQLGKNGHELNAVGKHNETDKTKE